MFAIDAAAGTDVVAHLLPIIWKDLLKPKNCGFAFFAKVISLTVRLWRMPFLSSASAGQTWC
jgi:hypothetical protein